MMRQVLGPYRGRGLVLVHGAARGGGLMAAGIWKEWGEKDEPHPARWEGPCRPGCRPGHRKASRGRSWCPAAGMYRNAEVIQGVFAVEAFIRDASAGATGCVQLAKQAGVRHEVHEYGAELEAG